MKTALLTGAAMLMAVSSVAFAQTTQVPSGQAPAGVTSSSPDAAKASAMNSTDNARAGRLADAGGMFTNVPTQADLSSKLVGLSVYNSENTDIGTIKDIAFDANGVKAYIVAVGGFLGMGDHYVAVRPSAINISYHATKDKWQASMNTDADQLKSAPEFKYSNAG
jgi:sporulation protein YlmC with PRC-barrel domain